MKRYEYRSGIGIIDIGDMGGGSDNILMPEASSNLSDRVCFCGQRMRWFDLPELGHVVRCCGCGNTIKVDDLKPEGKIGAKWDGDLMLVQPEKKKEIDELPNGARIISEEDVPQ